MGSNDVLINVGANTENFQVAIDKAYKTLSTFGVRNKDLATEIDRAYKGIERSAASMSGSIQSSFNSLQVKSDAAMAALREASAKASQSWVADFTKIANSADTTANDVMRAFRGLNLNEAKLEANALSSEFKSLGIQSTASIEAMKIKIQNDFKEIEISGTKYPQDIVRAHEAMVAKITELDGLLVTSAEKAAVAKMNLAHEEALAEIKIYEDASLMNMKFEYDKQRAAEKTAAEQIRLLKEVQSAQERASVVPFQNTGSLANSINSSFTGNQAGSDFSSQLREQAQYTATMKDQMAGYAAAAMQGEATAAKLVNQVHAGSDFTAQLKEQMGGVTKSTGRVREGINGWSLASVAAIAKIQILYSIINQTMSAIGAFPKTAMDAIEDYNSAVIANAATITSMASGVKDVGAEYKKNKEYASAVQSELVGMSASTIASAEQLHKLNNEFILQGVYLDTNNEKQKQGFLNIANAVAVIGKTMGNENIQFAEQVRQVMEGVNRPNAQLFRTLLAIDPLLKEHLVTWRAQGTVLENLGPMLQGYAAATGDISNLWTTVKTTMSSIYNSILRGGFSDGFSQIVSKMKEISQYAKDNKEKIQAMLSDGFKDAKQAAGLVWDIGKALTTFAEPAKIAAIASGFYAIATAIQAMNAKLMLTPLGALAAIAAVGARIGSQAATYYQDDETAKKIASTVPQGHDAKAMGMMGADFSNRNLEHFGGTQLQAIREKIPMVSNDQIVQLLRAGSIKIVEDYSTGIVRWVAQIDKTLVDSFLNPSAKVKTPKGIKGLNTAKPDYTEYNESIKAYNAVIKLMDDWELEATKSGKVQDELGSKIEAVNVKIANQKREFAKANAFGKDTQEMWDYIDAMGKAEIANLTLASTKKGQAEYDKAEAAANLEVFRNGLANQESALKESFEGRKITEQQYYEDKSKLIKVATSNELQTLNDALDKQVEKAINAPNRGAELIEWGKVLTLETQIAKVTDDSGKKQNDWDSNHLKYLEEFKTKQIELQKQVQAIQGGNSAFAVGQVGTDSKTGIVTDQYSHEKAMAQDALVTKLQLIEIEKAAWKDKAEKEVGFAKQANDAIVALTVQGQQAQIATAQKIALEKLNAEKGLYDQIATIAGKTFPKITAFQTAAALMTKKYAQQEVIDTETGKKTMVLSTQGKMQMMSDYGGLASNIMSDMANSENQATRQGFENAKAYNLGAAVMSTAAGIMAQLSGPDGWAPSAWARAALVGVMGVVQIAKIASTSFGGGGGVAPVSQGSFGGGASGGAGVGGSIGNQLTSVHDSQTSADLQNLTHSMNNASLAMGKVADGLTKVADLFQSGGFMSLAAGTLPTTGIEKGGLISTLKPVLTQSIKDGLLTAGFNFQSLKGFIVSTVLPGLGGLASSIFGGSQSVEDSGLSIAIEKGFATALNYTKVKTDGGWFGSDSHSTYYSNNSQMSGVINSALSSIKETIIRGAAATGTTANISSVSIPEVQISTAGKKPEDIQKELQTWLENTSNEFAKTTVGLKDFAFYGENAFDAIVRLSTALQSANEQLSLVGARLITSTLAGANAAYKLEDLMGGADKFNEKINNYFTGMFTDQEQSNMKATQAARQMQVAFAEMGYSVPQTKQQFIALVNSLDLTTDSGAKTFAALMDISDAATLVYNHVDEIKKAQLDLDQDVTSRYLKAVGNTAAADIYDLTIQQTKELQDAQDKGLVTTQLLTVQALEMADAAKKAATSFSDAQKVLIDASKTSLTDLISNQQAALNAIKSIMTGSDSQLSPEAAYNAAQEQFNTATAKDLPNAVTALLTASKAMNATGPAFQVDLQKGLAALGTLADVGNTPTLTVAEQQLTTLQNISDLIQSGNIDQLANLQGILGNNAALTGLLTSYLQANTSATAANQAAITAGEIAAATSKIRTVSWADIGAHTALNMVVGLTTPDLQYDVNKDGQITIVDALMLQKMAVGQLPLPTYATGGYHAGGLRIVGENGPELEATGPARYFNADQTRGILSKGTADNSEVELKEIIRQLTELVRVSRAGHVGTIEAIEETALDKSIALKLSLAKAA